MSTALSIDQIAVIQSPLVGDSSNGRTFSDIDDIFSNNGTAEYDIDADYPLKRITLTYGGVIDGITIDYKKTGAVDDTVTVSHGTATDRAYITDPTLRRVEINLKEGDQIIAVNGRHGPSHWGKRVSLINFIVYNSNSGEMTLNGPYGGGGSDDPFSFTANGRFLAVSGTAINSNLSLAQLKDRKLPGGLYGLVFCDVVYKPI